MSKIENKKHIFFIDGLRAMAALYVVVGHAILQKYNSGNINSLSQIKSLSFNALAQGRLAVNLFIVISGFSLMLSVIKTKYRFKNGALDFFRRRAIRILPPYYFALIISLLLIWLFIGEKTGTHWDECLPVTTVGILTHILLIHDFFVSHTSEINHALWSISVECRIYILFPLLLLLWRKTGPFVTLLISLITVFIMLFFLTYIKAFFPDIDNAARGVNPYLVLFVLGMFAADIIYSDSVIAGKLKKLPWGIMLIVSVILFVIVRQIIKIAGYGQDIIPERILDIAFGICCFCLLLVCAQINKKGLQFSWISKFLSWQPLVFIGTFSYSIYLIHPPLLQLIQQYVLFPLHLDTFIETCLLATLGTIVIVGFSYIFFIFCERPFLNMLKSKKVSVAEFETISPAP